MRIAILGYGKMGKVIEEIAKSRGHSIVIKTDSDNPTCDIKQVDVAIDFSSPHIAFNNITMCFKNGVPVVCGTTGWLDKYDRAVEICKNHNGGFIYASNFSLGVNLFFQLNEHLAKIISKNNQYKADILDIHHKQKLDTPSGTAIKLAEGVIRYSNYKSWELTEAENQNVKAHTIPVFAERIDDVTGTHRVRYAGETDEIYIVHKAHNRKGFALGAVIATEWLKGKTGVFSMREVLNIR
ncbi:4-hydroxy-tetrahydrodipicolinate reductase [Elysia marginata]|uniref:4-hydroxy-tetrahydrodipicolinate reductase n=1 Tax=Elysia marginata TaxID=1093978 RepID=A0AAV4GS20_9GAST|nr:4-hydroxy-tetrahydrodipicolinate reductase [Elysia marginata]